MIQIDHNEYPKSLISKSYNQLKFIMKDAHEAMMANPESPKAGYYADEINYCAMELAKRNRSVPKVQKYFDDLVEAAES